MPLGCGFVTTFTFRLDQLDERLRRMGRSGSNEAKDRPRPVAFRKLLHHGVCPFAHLRFPPMRVHEQVGVHGDHGASEPP